MKLNKNIILALVLLIVIAAIYRIIPNRPLGFAPQIAMALFGGALFTKNKKWAFLLPIVSMFISDALYQLLYINELSQTKGFYSGQITNYLLFAGLTVIGFGIKTTKVPSIIMGIIVAPTVYFLVSNGLVWANGGGYHHPKTLSGMLACLADGIPFYQGSLIGTTVFATLLFGGYYIINQRIKSVSIAK